MRTLLSKVFVQYIAGGGLFQLVSVESDFA